MADEPNQSHMISVDIEAEMKKSYLDYAMSVIVARAIPDVRDGLKPVHRRILLAMNDLGLTSNRGYRKCAKIGGELPASTIRTARPSSIDAWCAWRSPSTCATRWWTARATSARWTAIRRRPCGTPKRAWRASAKNCWRISKKKPSISFPISTRRAKSPSSCRRAFPTCWSTAPAASPSAWPRTFRRTT